MGDTCNRTLFSLKKEGNPALCVTAWMTLENIILGEVNRCQKENTARFHVCEVLKRLQLLEAETRTVVTRSLGWGSGKWGVVAGVFLISRNLLHLCPLIGSFLLSRPRRFYTGLWEIADEFLPSCFFSLQGFCTCFHWPLLCNPLSTLLASSWCILQVSYNSLS